MKVTFTLTPEERRRTINAWLKSDTRQVNALVGPLVCLVLFAACIGVILFQAASYGPARPEIAAAMPGMVGCLIAGAIFLVLVLRTKQSTVESPTTLTIDEAGVEIEVVGKTTSIPWSDIVDVRLTSLAIIILTEGHFDHVVPRRAFDAPADAAAFYRQLAAFWNPPPAAPPPIPNDENVWPPAPGSTS